MSSLRYAYNEVNLPDSDVSAREDRLVYDYSIKPDLASQNYRQASTPDNRSANLKNESLTLVLLPLASPLTGYRYQKNSPSSSLLLLYIPLLPQPPSFR